jgi:hypothetical protein
MGKSYRNVNINSEHQFYCPVHNKFFVERKLLEVCHPSDCRGLYFVNTTGNGVYGCEG